MAKRITIGFIVGVVALLGATLLVVARYSGSGFYVHNACPEIVEISKSSKFDGQVWTLAPDDSVDEFPGATEVWVRPPSGSVFSANGAIGPLVDPGHVTILGSECDAVAIER